MSRSQLTPYISIAISHLLKELLTPLECAALVAVEGAKTIAVLPRDASDVATLSAAAIQCQQYLHLKDDDLAICNDPFTGGTQLADVTLIAGISLSDRTPAEFLISQRLRFQPGLHLTGKLIDEGLRIPPTPLGTLTSPHLEILSAIKSHPQAPHDFAAKVQSALVDLRAFKTSLRQALIDPKSPLKKVALKKYLEDCKVAFSAQMAKLALGDSVTTTRLACGPQVKLKLSVHDDKVQFDFSGSDQSATVNLTELTTFGLCFSAVLRAIGGGLPINSGAFDTIEVSAPVKTFLNAKAPAGTWRGMAEGAFELSEFLSEVFLKRNGPSASSHGGRSGFIEIKFADGRLFFDALSSGQGALAAGQGAVTNREGISASSEWLPQEFRHRSVESIETVFPILVKEAGRRTISGGSGEFEGGAGATRTYQVLSEARFRWSFPAGLEKKTSHSEGTAAELVLVRADGGKQDLELHGELGLHAGDEIKLSAAGGSGVGAPAKVEEEA